MRRLNNLPSQIGAQVVHHGHEDIDRDDKREQLILEEEADRDVNPLPQAAAQEKKACQTRPPAKPIPVTAIPTAEATFHPRYRPTMRREGKLTAGRE